ncbi:MAG: PIN domain-containing protein [Bacillota bacterium]|nr:PIN domain-containing protein [Bacillota bacterium]
MKVLLDTNIILDVILQRQPFAAPALEILKLSDMGKLESYIISNSITDIFYVLRKYFDNVEDRKKAVRYILQMVNIAGVTKTDIFKSLELEYTDFEDALQTQCAKKIKANYIITRNEKDFKDRSVEVISPERFIEMYKTK